MTTTLSPWDDFDPNHTSAFAAAVRQLERLLSDNHWHPWKDVITTVAPAHGLKPKTVDTVLRALVDRGQVERRGKYMPKSRRDHRMVRLPGGAK
ncbi:hypothetical protein MAHJHV63_35180 [Mycobacterium avium subsp. hominissuis]